MLRFFGIGNIVNVRNDIKGEKMNQIELENRFFRIRDKANGIAKSIANKDGKASRSTYLKFVKLFRKQLAMQHEMEKLGYRGVFFYTKVKKEKGGIKQW